MPQERRDHRQGCWERHQTERSSCPYVHACTVPAVTTPHALGEVPTRQSMAQQHIHTHTQTSQHITAQHSTAQHNPVSLTRRNTTHTTSSASWPLSCHLHYSTAQHSSPMWAQLHILRTCMHGPGQRNQIPSASSRLRRQHPPARGPTRFRQNPSDPGMGTRQSQQMRAHMDASHAVSQRQGGKDLHTRT